MRVAAVSARPAPVSVMSRLMLPRVLRISPSPRRIGGSVDDESRRDVSWHGFALGPGRLEPRADPLERTHCAIERGGRFARTPPIASNPADDPFSEPYRVPVASLRGQ